jgi:Cytochrome c7 and related cytochrome c
MPQLFPPWAATLLRVVIVTVPAALLLGAASWGVMYRSPYYTNVGVPATQPVPFSHEHHVGALGIDCRYCHSSVERSAFAGMPSSATCMRCHSQVWSQSAMLAPVRDSLRTGKPLRWTRVHDLPDYVYFDHSIHVAGGIGCVTCHGRVDRMPLTQKAHSLQMRWCLDCHRDPSRYRRPVSQVFNMDDSLAAQSPTVVQPVERSLMDCSTCHR